MISSSFASKYSFLISSLIFSVMHCFFSSMLFILSVFGIFPGFFFSLCSLFRIVLWSEMLWHDFYVLKFTKIHFVVQYVVNPEKAMATHLSTLAWKIPWTEELGRLPSMESQRVGHDWATSFSLFTFMHWRRQWQPTPVFLPGESQGRGSLVGYRLWGHTESARTEATSQQQQHVVNPGESSICTWENMYPTAFRWGT